MNGKREKENTRVLRDTEVPTHACLKRPRTTGCKCCPPPVRAPAEVPSRKVVSFSMDRQASINNYAVPQLNSVLQKVHDIKAVAKAPPELEANIKKALQPQFATNITHKLNFDPSDTLYKHLIPLNIDDVATATVERKGKARPSKTQGKRGPNLDDYTDPIPPFEYSTPSHRSISPQFASTEESAYDTFMKLNKAD